MSDNDKMREAFEKWALSNDGPSVSVTRNDVGRYEDEELNMAWLGWQAAQAEQSAELAAEYEEQLEVERIRLAACGVIAMSNTAESAAKARQMLPEYWSASAKDCANAVDREMSLRDRIRQLSETHAIELRAYEATVANLEAKVRELETATINLFSQTDRTQIIELVVNYGGKIANAYTSNTGKKCDAYHAEGRELLAKISEMLAAAPLPKKEGE